MRDVLYGWIFEHRDVGLLQEAANLCGHPVVTLAEILPLLDHSDPGVRYWAVLSIQAKGDEGRSAIEALRRSMKDESPSVAIASAELLCQYGLDEMFCCKVVSSLGDKENPTVVLQAAISIRKLGKNALPLIPLIEEIYPAYRGEVWDRYRDWVYPMFIGFALDQTYLNCGLDLP